jgi:hypothetical protein
MPGEVFDRPPEVDARPADVFAEMGAFNGGAGAGKPPKPGKAPATPLGRLAAIEDAIAVLAARLDAIALAAIENAIAALTARVDAIAPRPSPKDKASAVRATAATDGAPFAEAAMAAAGGPLEVDPDVLVDEAPPWDGADPAESAAFNVFRNLQARGWQVHLIPPEQEA